MLISTELSATKPDNASAGLAILLVGEDEYIFCPVRQKTYKVNNKPEEKVRFWWLYRLKNDYGYPFDQMAVEVPIQVGSTEAKKKADIVVYTDASRKTPRIIIEVKKPNRKDGVDQLKVYMNATGCRLGVWSNGASPHSYILKYTRVVAVVGLGGDMFKPFTNTKTCVLFLQKRPEPLTLVEEAKGDPKIVYAVTERPGKDKSGRLIRGKDGNIVSDLPDIAAYIKKKAIFLKA